MCRECTESYAAALAACEALDIHPEWPTFPHHWNASQHLYTLEERAAVLAFFQARRRRESCPAGAREHAIGA